jgi:hypothetical protein
MNEAFRFDNVTCASCHTAPGAGTNRRIQFFRSQEQPFKVAQLRNVYQKLGYSRIPGTFSRNGFGLDHDGVLSNLFDFLSQPQFNRFANDTARKLNLAAFLVCFDTGMAPAVGFSYTLTANRIDTLQAAATLALLVGSATIGDIDLIVKGTMAGVPRGWLYRPDTHDFAPDSAEDEPISPGDLREAVLDGEVLTVMGVPPGSGPRMGIDRDLDGVLDSDEL